MIRFYLRLFYYLLLACFLASVWGGWYLSRQGFGQKWRKKLSEEFALRGVELAAKRLTLDPWRGLVARNVQVYHDHRRQEVAGTINELQLEINYTRLLRGKPFLDALRLRDARLRIDLDSDRRKKKEIALDRLDAQIFFRENQLEIKHLSGRVAGMEVELSGILFNVGGWDENQSRRENWRRRVRISDTNWRRWQDVQLAKAGGRMEARFSSDFAQPQALQTAEVRLFLPSGEWRRASWRNLRVEADFSEGTATIRRLEWQDDQGDASFSGIWRPRGESHLAGKATINPTFWLRDTQLLKGFQLKGECAWDGSISWVGTATDSVRMIGKVDATQVLYRSVLWEAVRGQFSVEKERYMVRKLDVTLGSGTMTGEVWGEKGQISGELISTINPRVIWQSFWDTLPPLLRDAEFPGNPWWKIGWSGPAKTPGEWSVKGELVLGRTNFRGVTLTSSQVAFAGTPNQLRLDNLQITRPEGQLLAVGSWDAGAGRLSLREVKSSLNLVALGLWVDRSLAEAMETVRLPKGTNLMGHGWVDWKNGNWHRAEVELVSENVALLDTPLLTGLRRECPWLERPTWLETTARMDKTLLTLEPLRIFNEAGELTGNLHWDPVEKKVRGTLSALRGKTFATDSSWSETAWKNRD